MNNTYPYPYSAAEARKRNELSLWRESHKANIACRNAIEDAIRQNFDGMNSLSCLLGKRCSHCSGVSVISGKRSAASSVYSFSVIFINPFRKSSRLSNLCISFARLLNIRRYYTIPPPYFQL